MTRRREIMMVPPIDRFLLAYSPASPDWNQYALPDGRPAQSCQGGLSLALSGNAAPPSFHKWPRSGGGETIEREAAMAKPATLGVFASVCCWLWAGVAHGECNSSYFNPSPNGFCNGCRYESRMVVTRGAFHARTT